MRPTTLKTLASLAIALVAPLAAQAQAAAQPSGAATARVIVKYKSDSALLRTQAFSAFEQHEAQAQALGARVGLPLRSGHGVAERAQVVMARGMTSEALAARLAREKDVEYAVPDRRKTRAAVPNDTYYSTGPALNLGARTGGPVAGQWYLRAPAGEARSAINAEAAWDVTTGSASVVVAVLDTGVRLDHPDLAGKLLPGYDMVGADRDNNGNPLTTFLSAKDGNGRDSNPSDEGDGITLQETLDPAGLFYHCTPQDSSGQYLAEPSSWHGTQVSGLIGALTNNGTGMASVGRNVRVLPMRVLSKCGGWDSDIIAGMLWAAGIAVPGTPANPNPAKVLNMSLGGAGNCSPAYVDAVGQVNAQGAVIVASAGNGAGHAVSEPANCDGVIGVAGLRHVGTKVGYSDLGPEVSISAPAGNCVNTGANDPCLYTILTTSNKGQFDPLTDAAGGSIYTDAFNVTLGTSFSAPLVAGTAALMLSARPDLSPAELRRFLRSSARAFPSLAGVQACRAPSSADQDECNCTETTCGAGMLDAATAVTAAANDPIVRIDVTPAQPTAGTLLTLTSAQTALVAGRSIASWQWTLVSGGGIVSSLSGANTAAASATPTAGGSFIVTLTVTDTAGRTGSQTVEVSVAGAPPNSGGGGGALGLGWLAALLAAVLVLARARPAARGA